MDQKDEILADIKELEIDCPDCKYIDDDEQYTCHICWCQGGAGKLNVFEWLKDNGFLKKEKN